MHNYAGRLCIERAGYEFINSLLYELYGLIMIVRLIIWMILSFYNLNNGLLSRTL